MNKASVSGALFAAGWFAFFDAVIVQARFNRVPATSSVDWLPGFVTSLGASAIVSVPLDSLLAALDPNGGGAFVSARTRHCASCSLFFALSLAFAGVSLAVAVLQHNYLDSVPELVRATPAYCAWPGRDSACPEPCARLPRLSNTRVQVCSVSRCIVLNHFHPRIRDARTNSVDFRRRRTTLV